MIKEAAAMSSSDQYCLKWNNHKANLLSVFHDLFRDAAFTDVSLVCDGGVPIKCHKMVLAASSTYFQNLFTKLDACNPVIVLKDVRDREIQAILDYMYKGEVSITIEEVKPLLVVAENLKVKGLVGHGLNDLKECGSSTDEYSNAISTSSPLGAANAASSNTAFRHNRDRSRSVSPATTPRGFHSGGMNLNMSSLSQQQQNSLNARNVAAAVAQAMSGFHNLQHHHHRRSSISSPPSGGSGAAAVDLKPDPFDHHSSPPHSTGIHPSFMKNPYIYQNGGIGAAAGSSSAIHSNSNVKSATATAPPADNRTTINRFPPPIQWPPLTSGVTYSPLYERAMAAAGITGNGIDASSLSRRKKYSYNTSSHQRDTPILRTVLGQGHQSPLVDPAARPPSTLCNVNDGQERSSPMNGPMTSQDAYHKMKNESSIPDYNMDHQSFMDDESMHDGSKVAHSSSSSPESKAGGCGMSASSSYNNQSQRPEWKRYKQYTKQDISSAIQAVKEGMSALQASKKFGVPSRTLYDKVKKMGISPARTFKQQQQRPNGSTAGPSTSFPYGLGGAGAAMLYGGMMHDEESSQGGGLPGPFDHRSFLQNALETGRLPMMSGLQMPPFEHGNGADREAIPMLGGHHHMESPPSPHNDMMRATTAMDDEDLDDDRGVLERATTAPSMTRPPPDTLNLPMGMDLSIDENNSGGGGGRTSSNSPAPPPPPPPPPPSLSLQYHHHGVERSSPPSNYLSQNQRLNANLTASPTPPPTPLQQQQDDSAEDFDNDQVEDLSMGRRREQSSPPPPQQQLQSSRVIMPPMSQSTATMLANCNDSVRDCTK